MIQIPLDDFDENISLKKIHFEDVGIIFEGDDTAKLVVPKSHYGAWLMTLLGILIIGGLYLRLYRKNNQAEKVEVTKIFNAEEKTLPVDISKKPIKNSKANYKGKLVLYITKLAEEEDFAPREFNLFRMNVEKIPLSYVLEKCNIFGVFPNAKNIFISPENREISLENQSDCTITKRNAIIEKGGRVDLYYNDSVNIASKDETAEMILVYKSLKPN